MREEIRDRPTCTTRQTTDALCPGVDKAGVDCGGAGHNLRGKSREREACGELHFDPLDVGCNESSATSAAPLYKYVRETRGTLGPEPNLAPSAVSAPALSVERLTVRDDRIVCDLLLSPEAPRRTTPAMAARVQEAFPGIGHHACVNGEGDVFAAVIDHTSLPHLLEHLVIDLQAHAASANLPAGGAAARRPGPVFVGTTDFVDDACTRARVELSFVDDLVALRAINEALAFVNDLAAKR